MPRNPDEARNRLRQAALELFTQDGFEQTTAAQIAGRAGVTERTFFRHFADKREVLFEGQAILGAALVEAIAAAPMNLPPMLVLRQAFDAVAPILESHRRYSEPRQRIIAATPALQEREAAKHAALLKVVSEAIEERGVEPYRASLASQMGLGALTYALTAWFADSSVPLGTHLERAFTELHGLVSSHPQG